MVAASAGWKFYDARRKKQVADMLQTASGETVAPIANLLKDIDPDAPTGFKALLSKLQFSRHAQEQIQQAGLNWSASRLLIAMGLAMIPGLGIGAWTKILLNGTTSAIIFAIVTGMIPYMIVRHKRTVRLNKLEEQFPDALDFLARSMRAGHAFSISLEMIGEEMADPLGRSSGRCSTSRTWARPWMSRCVTSRCGYRCSTCVSSLPRCCCRSRRAAI